MAVIKETIGIITINRVIVIIVTTTINSNNNTILMKLTINMIRIIAVAVL